MGDTVVWSVNTKGIIKGIQDHLVKTMQRLENKLIELMREEVKKIDHKGTGGHGAPEWERDVLKAIRVVYRDIANNYIESGVGIPDNSPEWLWIEASVYESGVGSQADPVQPTIKSKPGEDTWQSTSYAHPRIYQDESSARDVYPIYPLNQKPTYFIENAMKAMSKYFDDVCAEAMQTLPDDLFFNNFHADLR